MSVVFRYRFVYVAVSLQKYKSVSLTNTFLLPVSLEASRGILKGKREEGDNLTLHFQFKEKGNKMFWMVRIFARFSLGRGKENI